MTQTVFITGISSGIGEEATRRLIAEGYTVIGTVRKIEDRDRLINQFSDKLHCLICDITDDNAVDMCIEQTGRILDGNKLYALINNAGIAVPGPMHMISDEKFYHQMDVNLFATRKITNKLIPHLENQTTEVWPRIIFISSVSGIFAAPFNGAYCVSKHALECLVDIYRRELRYLNIKVVSILPGPIKTRIWEKAQGQFDDYKKGAFAKIADRADKIIASTEQMALPVEQIGDLIYKIIKTAQPKNRYMIHKKAWLLKLLAYGLPSSIVDKMVWKNLDKSDSKTYRPA